MKRWEKTIKTIPNKNRSTEVQKYILFMKLQNKSLIILLILFFHGCVARKSSIEYKEKIIKDTVYKNVKETIVERFTDTLTIEHPCDSLGNLKPFKQSIKISQGNINLTGYNNVISAEIDLKGYKKIWEKEFVKQYESDKHTIDKKVVKLKYPLWLIIYSIGITVICVLLLKR